MGYTIQTTRWFGSAPHVHSVNVSPASMAAALNSLLDMWDDGALCLFPSATVRALLPGVTGVRMSASDCRDDASPLAFAAAEAYNRDLPSAWVLQVLADATSRSQRGGSTLRFA